MSKNGWGTITSWRFRKRQARRGPLGMLAAIYHAPVAIQPGFVLQHSSIENSPGEGRLQC